MAEQDGFEARLRSAVRQYAADVSSDADPLALAARVTHRSRTRWPWPAGGRWPSAVPAYLVWTLILLAMLGMAVVGVAALLRQPPHLGLGTPGRIAFDAGGHVIVTAADGTGGVELSPAGGAYLPSWSPDGTRLAFWREDGATFSIVVADATGRALVVIPTQQPTGDPYGMRYAGGAGGPIAWSPDSTRIAAWMWVGSGGDAVRRIFVASLDGSPPRVVGDPSIPAVDPGWSPDGRNIVFAGLGHLSTARGVDRTAAGVFVMAADGSDVRRISQAHALLAAPDTTSFREPQWQPGGDLIAYQASADGILAHIFVVHADGTGLRDVTAETRQDAADEDAYPVWSPDGAHLALARFDARAGGFHPVLLPASGGAARVIASVTVDTPRLTWSPDAERLLAYQATTSYGRAPGVLRVDLATGVVAQRMPLASELGGCWQRLPR